MSTGPITGPVVEPITGPITGPVAGPDFEHPEAVLCPGGPMLLRGSHLVADADGVEHATTRPVSAVCRCLRSAVLPWCDGTHKRLPAHLRP